MGDRFPRLSILPHRHRAAQVSRFIDLDGAGDLTSIELCACSAYRQVGARVWRGSHFRKAVR